VNLFSAVELVALVLPHMREQKWGRVISIGGVSARQSTIYGLRNAAVVHLTKTLSDQLGGDGITLNVVHPGLTLSEVIEDRLNAQAESQGVSRDEVNASVSQNVAIGRPIDPQELAWLTAYLASPKAECITGETIAAGGGAKGGVHQ
jgi:NAD(P)-dependent dehydrogenase (short-subunit alcohol dehydrogenase family)